ncbi:hypothetical protein EXIGLDRAFT_722057 [Exidia glandulosa HHB12029]|uniref:F-box domain-containing protein n=1 Tax=Exidia glandulosa HHB12029 TaxID=1314781 RepID=A0A165FHR2_EXIGL|nr:hypothetical protein EXIGLDRAFT_722057 [Exidia glandulosa HHB12029]
MALLRRCTVHNLPDELVTHALSFLTFRELLTAAQVSQRWRDLGIEHHNFWKYILITSATRGQVELLRARLGQSNGRPFHLKVDIEGRNPLIPKDILSLVNCMLDAVEILNIRLESWYLTEVYRVLNRAAPKLEKFSIMFYSPDRILPLITLYSWIFASSPGNLRTVNITDVLLPSHKREIPAFTTVDSVVYTLPSSVVMPAWPSYLFEHFPNMSSLYLEGGRITFGDKKLSELDINGLAQLAVLDVTFHPDTTAEIIRRLPIQEIPHVLIGCESGVDFDTVYDLLEPLRSPFHLSLLSAFPDEFWIIVEEVFTGNQRVYAEAVSRWPLNRDETVEMPNVILDNPDLPGQLQSLGISATMWPRVVPYLTLFTTIETLVLEFDQVHKACHNALPEYPFTCPLVHTLVLDARFDIEWINADDLVTFADRIAPNCRHVELRRVMIEGRDRLGARFETVKSVDGRRWTHQSSFTARERGTARIE